METRCPRCGSLSVAAQDIEALSDSVLLVKLDKRIQLCCQACGWMECQDITVNRVANEEIKTPSSQTGRNDSAP